MGDGLGWATRWGGVGWGRMARGYVAEAHSDNEAQCLTILYLVSNYSKVN